ncbi:dTDP-glucose 4,6-dehydratase, partial [Trypanosoma cruzi]
FVGSDLINHPGRTHSGVAGAPDQPEAAAAASLIRVEGATNTYRTTRAPRHHEKVATVEFAAKGHAESSVGGGVEESAFARAGGVRGEATGPRRKRHNFIIVIGGFSIERRFQAPQP